MDVSVIIPTYNEEKDISTVLSSLRSQSIKNIEIIVVDDGSRDKTIEIVKRFKGVKIIKGKHAGPGTSRNIGAKNANGEILIFVDADMSFDPDYVKNLIKPIIEKEEIIGTTHDFEVATNTDRWISKMWGEIRVSPKSASEVKIFRAIRKKKFLEMGGFDPKYGYADDQTFWYKFGVKPVVSKNTKCYHKNPETLEETYKQAKWIGASWKERKKILGIFGVMQGAVLFYFLFLPFLVIFKSLKDNQEIKRGEKIKFYETKLRGYGIGFLNSVFYEKNWR